MRDDRRQQSFAAAIEALQGGGMIVLHPEGTVTRDPDGWPMRAKTGAARLAMLAPDVSVFPIAQWGVQQQRLRHDLAVLRVPGSTGELYQWRRAGETPMGAP